MDIQKLAGITQTAQPKSKKTQVIGCRVTLTDWNNFERKCLERGIPMSEVLKSAVHQYIQN
jgi:predicted DNA binding CopG/RHH family protein